MLARMCPIEYVSRREALTSIIPALLMSGCLHSTESADLMVANHTNETKVVNLVVRRSSDGAEILNSTTEMEADQIKKYWDPIKKEGTFEISITVNNSRRKSYSWNTTSDAEGVLVAVNRDSIRFSNYQ